MSNYGADAEPNLEKTFQLMESFGLLPLERTNVMQWTYIDNVVRKLANRQDGSNVLFLLLPDGE